MQLQKRFRTLITLLATLVVAACSSSHITTQALDDNPDESTSVERSFALASDFPSDLTIPAIEGMRSTAFVVSTTDPAGVIAIDLDTTPLALSTTFQGMTVPAGAGIPSRLVIDSRAQAFLLTSNAVISFNPETGAILDLASVIAPITIDVGPLNSDGSTAATTIVPAYPGGIATTDTRLFISSANLLHTQAPAVAAPGLVQVFSRSSSGDLERIDKIVTSHFNPTGLAIRQNRELIVLNSGIIDIIDAHGEAQTDAAIDIIDVNSLAIVKTIPLGKIAASPWGLAMTQDGSRAFIGSASRGQVFEIDLINRQVLHGISNPIVVTDPIDYIASLTLSVDERYLFVASFEQSAVIPLDLSTTPPALSGAFVVGFPAGVTEDNPSGANTGAGPLAVRPGVRDTDYTGEDLFVLTGYPGKLVGINTGNPASTPTPPTLDADDDTSPPAPPVGSSDTPCQGYAQAVTQVTYGTGAGFGQSSMPNIVLGPPRGTGTGLGSTHVLSLGVSGEIVLDLGNCPAVDGTGADFIVFENAFYIGGNVSAPYAEPAIVGVSSDGITFTDFPCTATAYPYDGCAGTHPVLSNPANSISPFDAATAGGEAYDLSELGIAKARYIRIRDAGNGGAGGSAGFDLDAIAVINGSIL